MIRTVLATVLLPIALVACSEGRAEQLPSDESVEKRILPGGNSSYDVVYANQFLVPQALGWQSGPQMIVINTGAAPIDINNDFRLLNVQSTPPAGITVEVRVNSSGIYVQDPAGPGGGSGMLPANRAVGSTLPVTSDSGLVGETRVVGGGDPLIVVLKNVPAAFTTFAVTATISMGGDTRPISFDIISDPAPARWENPVRQSSL